MTPDHADVAGDVTAPNDHSPVPAVSAEAPSDSAPPHGGSDRLGHDAGTEAAPPTDAHPEREAHVSTGRIASEEHALGSSGQPESDVGDFATVAENVSHFTGGADVPISGGIEIPVELPPVQPTEIQSLTAGRLHLEELPTDPDGVIRLPLHEHHDGPAAATPVVAGAAGAVVLPGLWSLARLAQGARGESSDPSGRNSESDRLRSGR